MRRTPLILATAVLFGCLAAAPAQGQDDPATCVSLGDFELHAATIVGTPGDDTLRGTEGPDVIVGLGGDDTIFGLGGDDVTCGDLGGDRIDGGKARRRFDPR
jgi:Ca2+-binding RTX toxin-like protein